MLEKYSEEVLKKDYLTKKQACELLGVSERTINRYIARWDIKTICIKKYRYIDKKSFEKCIEEFYNR